MPLLINAVSVVGVTTYMNVDNHTPRVEIGSTWYAKEVQRTGINTEAKYLLLKYALEDLQCIAVEFRTHILNQTSRRAIERLGAKLDGILRNHRLTATVNAGIPVSIVLPIMIGKR